MLGLAGMPGGLESPCSRLASTSNPADPKLWCGEGLRKEFNIQQADSTAEGLLCLCRYFSVRLIKQENGIRLILLIKIYGKGFRQCVYWITTRHRDTRPAGTSVIFIRIRRIFSLPWRRSWHSATFLGDPTSPLPPWDGPTCQPQSSLSHPLGNRQMSFLSRARGRNEQKQPRDRPLASSLVCVPSSFTRCVPKADSPTRGRCFQNLGRVTWKQTRTP